MPQVFGWEHLTYLAVVIVLMVAGTFAIKKFVKSEKVLTIVIKSIAGALLLCILWNRISIAYYAKNWMSLIPDTFCGCASTLLSISVLIFKKNNPFFHFIVYLALLGGFLTLIYPDFVSQNVSLFYSKTISGLLHHTLLFYLALIMILTGYFKPSIKKWYILPFGLTGLMTYGLFLITALKYKDCMQIYSPLIEGTPFTWWFTGILFVILQVGCLLTYELIKSKLSKKKQNNQIENKN